MLSLSRLVFLLLLPLALSAGDSGITQADWPRYQGDDTRNQYSGLTQVTPENAHLLEVAWTFQTGDGSDNGTTQMQCNPLIIDGILYGTSPRLKLFALDAATGRELWRFTPQEQARIQLGLNANRGVVFWEGDGEKRIYYTAGELLFCVNAENGELVKRFGGTGYVSLKKALPDWSQELFVASTTPGVIYQNNLIMGTRVSEGPGAAPGYIRAFDIHTGEVNWNFRTIPKPGEFGYETWPPEAYKTVGGANSWAGMALDHERGIVYIPTGSASFDFYGGNRHGQNLFANCLLALNAATGEYIWHFQTVHHDLWDRDLPAPPNLITVTHDGREVDAVAQITKSAHIFVFDRETGHPLWPIEYRQVPASDLTGEQAWPVQPFPTKPVAFNRQALTMENITQRTPEANNYVARKLEAFRTGGQFIPPSKQGTIIFPGFDGGGEWGGASFDPHSGLLYVNSSEMAWVLMMIELGETDRNVPGARTYLNYCAMCHGPDMMGNTTGVFPTLIDIEERLSLEELHEVIRQGRNMMPGFNHIGDSAIEDVIDYITRDTKETPQRPQDAYNLRHAQGMDEGTVTLPYTNTGYNRFLDPEGYPAVEPPWGQLNAINLNTGEIAWQVPLGDYPEVNYPGVEKTGTENYGGPVATDGGVIFIAATKDGYFRVFDKTNGEELAAYKLPAGGYATPSVYAVDGRQYIVIACGGGKMQTPSGDYYVAFALPEAE